MGEPKRRQISTNTVKSDQDGDILSIRALQEVGAGAFFRRLHAEALGFQSRDIDRMIEDGQIERVARGLYRLTSEEPTEHYTIAAVCARIPKAIVCLLSALTIHELTTQLPPKVWIALPNKAREPRIPEFPVRAVRFSGQMLRYGVETTQLEGVPVQITNPARTVVDCFRFRRTVGRDVATEALKDALADRKATADQIWRTAEVCRAQSIVGPALQNLIV